jgi:transposase
MSTRKKYSKEFKLDAISLVLEQQYSRVEAARSLNINPNMIARWIKERQQDDDGQAFRGNGKLTPEQEEIRTLKAPGNTEANIKGSDGLLRQRNEICVFKTLD